MIVTGENIKDVIEQNRRAKYGGDLTPYEIFARLVNEMDYFENGPGLDWLSQVANEINEMRERGEYVIPRLWVNNSLVLYFLGIGTVNPLPPHGYCPHCHEYEWSIDGVHRDVCPKCGHTMIWDGFDLPFDLFKRGFERKGATLDFSALETKKIDDLRIQCFAQEGITLEIKMAKHLGLTQKDIESDLDWRSILGIAQACIKRMDDYLLSDSEAEAKGRFKGLHNLENMTICYCLCHSLPVTMGQVADVIAGCHGRGVANGNIALRHKGMRPRDVVLSRDGMYRWLTDKGLSADEVLRIIGEICFHGDGSLSKEGEDLLRSHGVDEEHIELFKGFHYMFYKGHCAAEMRLEYRLADIYLREPDRYFAVLAKAGEPFGSGHEKSK